MELKMSNVSQLSGQLTRRSTFVGTINRTAVLAATITRASKLKDAA
jgi:hypothetical protein